MNLYISDLHFGHSSAINFDHRPFADVDEMDRVMIKLWNSRVAHDDHVYILGDFCYRNSNPAECYNQLMKEFDGAFETVEFAVYCSEKDKRNYEGFEQMLGSI